MTLTPSKLVFLSICSFLCGCAFFADWLHIHGVRNSPIVTGQIVSRTPIKRLGFIPGVDFAIRLDGAGTEVHARAAKYLAAKVPDTVRLRYSGDPEREVFLFEYEEGPLWIFVFFWAGALFMIGLIVALRRSSRLRQALGGYKDEPA